MCSRAIFSFCLCQLFENSTWRESFRCSLASFFANCEAVDPILKELLNPARDLTVFAWEFRYPGEAEAPSREEVSQTILARLPQEARPLPRKEGFCMANDAAALLQKFRNFGNVLRDDGEISFHQGA
jgi:hypothetical protein